MAFKNICPEYRSRIELKPTAVAQFNQSAAAAAPNGAKDTLLKVHYPT